MALDKNYADNYIKKIKASVPPGEYSDIKNVVIAYYGGTDTSKIGRASCRERV